ncbi:IspD/TarI family cytidylyltransferase [Mordavella massiliensis]|uniref:2-C-methyl-D-erythritol 4-phosphate cytidylyltransferase n=1 Tax=Mordavella massiliensis TaxID=1871024 RepID=A0A938XD22_9CLOT|nr:IspD/TarI family cytidylyltransferase [Mordavella massiliensis]MBM6948822.1 2-C-methyl-D-erythritol 4-phosphate cytidylyltransferase [Mordavella massiliensis]
MNIAILTAAGTGTRMHQDIPKQFLHVDNKPIIAYTMQAFQEHPSIDAIVVVTLEAWEEVLYAYAKQFNISKLSIVVKGGNTGQESIYNGLVAIKEKYGEEHTVLVHDGNRPLVSTEIISDALATFRQYGSAVAAIPCVEAMFTSKDGVLAEEEVPRERAFRTQTPHVYTVQKLLWAHEEAKKKNIVNTAASCTLLYELGEKIYFSRGSEENFKITTTDDLTIFKAMLKTRKEEWIK